MLRLKPSIVKFVIREGVLDQYDEARSTIRYLKYLKESSFLTARSTPCYDSDDNKDDNSVHDANSEASGDY
jgi:hypothetical protein